MHRAVVLTIDGLGGYLGPYGNTWIETPALNRLAAESILYEFALSDSPQLARSFRAYWTGLHALAGEHAAAPSLMDQAARQGLPTVLLTDDRQLADSSLARQFQERITVPVLPIEQPAADIGQTQLARLLAAASDWLQRATGPYLLWIHSQGLYGPWDAPFELRRRMADEGDPEPPDFVAPPVLHLAADYDPDLLLGIQQAYAGQIALLDECLGGFLDLCHDLEAESPLLLVLTAPRGYPLGEHRRIGPVDEAIYGERLHVPCLVRGPRGAGATLRRHELVQPYDLYATCCRHFGFPCGPDRFGLNLLETAAGEFAPPRDRACAVSATCRAIRVPHWFLHLDADGPRALYTKPDDRWEANEVSELCGEVTEELERVWDEFQRAVQTGNPADLTPLPAALRQRHE